MRIICIGLGLLFFVVVADMIRRSQIENVSETGLVLGPPLSPKINPKRFWVVIACLSLAGLTFFLLGVFHF